MHYDIEKLEELPTRGKLSGKDPKLDYNKRWHRRQLIKGTSIYKFLNRFLNQNINKSYSMAYSYFCKICPKNLRYYWHYYFKPDDDYYIDENGLIQFTENHFKWENKKKNRERHFISCDYFIIVKEKISNKIIKLSYYEYHRLSDWSKKWYEILKITGQEFRYKTKTIEIKNIIKNDQLKRKRLLKKEIKNKKEKSYCFLTKDEIELKTQQKIDEYKLYQHGFDKNNFKGEGYHGQQRKRKLKYHY